MNVICTLLVCIVVPGSTQDLSSASPTLFLISGPEVLRAGTPTPLAVTVFDDFPGRVTAEVAHGDTKVTQTEDFQGGLTSILTLPPIPGSITQNSLLNLTVRGFKEDAVIFTNTTTLSFDLRNVSTFIQTDRSRYEPGDTVKVRIVVIQLDNHPYKGRVDVSVQDPSGNVVDRWESTGNLGIVLQEFTLSQTPPLGQWTITTTVNGVTDEKEFTVELYERPRFEVLVKMPSQILAGDDITGSVRALYPSGQPLHGTLAVSVIMYDAVKNTSSPFLLTQTTEIYGSAQFFFSKDQLQALHTSSAFSSSDHVTVHVAACVNDSVTGFKVNKTVKVHLMKNTFQLMFHHFPPSLKPGLHFFTNLSISRYDQMPLSTSDRIHSAVVEVTQRTAMMNGETTTLTLPVPEDGNVHIQFRLQDEVVMLFIRARFQSSEETLKVYTNHSSPSGSYVQILPVDTLPAQIGSPFVLSVEATLQPAELHFVVSSQGQVVSAGTTKSLSFSLTPALSWSPEACVTVYCILSDGEVAADTARIPISQHNHVSLTWSVYGAQPGEKVSLTVATLESRSQVGVVVLGTHDDALESDLDVKVEQDCNLRMLTNARLYKKKQPDGAKNGHVLMIQKYWRHLLNVNESFLWLDTTVSEKTWTSGEITVPDGVTSLKAFALVMSENLGLGFTPVPQKLIVSKDFSLSMAVPPHLIRGEEIVLEVNVINHLGQDIEVIVLLAQSEAFEFVLTDRRQASVINAQKLTLRSHVSASALFPIRPLAVGEMEISVDAVSAEGSDGLARRVTVKPEGVEQSFSQTLFLELEPDKYNSSRSVSFSYPADVVPGSQRAYAVLVGDILALSINNLDSLVQMPLGCGEQNMIRFAPSVYVLQYLDRTPQDNAEIRSRTLRYMMDGYKRQLSYQRDDGSFSAFGSNDTAGSTWLTAFVLRSFLQAQPYIQVDQSVLSRAITWLFKQQGPQGEFREAGRLIHTAMQGGLDGGPVALTAYVLAAVLEGVTDAILYTDNVSLAESYLRNQVSSGAVGNYSLSLAAYALALTGSPVAGTALNELNRRADYADGVKMWRSSTGLRSHDLRPGSVQIEMASYVMLALFRRGSFIEGIALMKWLSRQRNHLGGYGTTQDTVVAIQALARYATFSGANTINLRFNISTPTSSSLFRINSTNYLSYQSQEINAEKDPRLNIYMEGRGFALFQLNVFYHLETEAFSQHLKQTRDEEAFSLDVEVVDDGDHNHIMLSICMRLKDNQAIPQTGMAILDVGMLSGFTLSPGAAVPGDLIRKVEVSPEKVSLYLDSITKSKVCIILPLVTNYKVAHMQDAVLRVYDYYEPSRKATTTYNLRFLHNVGSCYFCGVNCNHCKPAMTIIKPSSYSSSSAIYSLSCLFLALASFLVVV
ncbi:CD109 antigen-like isoform X2 [Stegastes partitus]|uniref:CD109 antigen-like isoform X2 n=1 Tax=Stegastes partitus TaxID=144197 RepID=A0A9Y4JGH3_9TELE|nr:PREDICTED: CD109 antigen-like isoform X2 [Stegastes partitus]